jgi:hyperosmotically inducible protein
MKRLSVFALGLALLALTAACATDATNSNNSNANLSNTNRAANANNANAANTNTANSNRRIDPNISEADYEREKDRYGREAREAGDTIGSGLKDGWLHVKTKGALLAADDLRDSTINVDVDNAAVTLRGSVASAAQKSRAEAVAKGISGVTSVKNNLTVRADGAAGNANNANHSGNH